ncbi:transcriptional regulator, AraC family [Mesorhizobium australicum]|uniref:Transcriptional regulator, AraC family n=2 Tax=Mesorhizobium australicum TaxID=536018 RepID=A0A1X7PTD0_9HYPH|nr:transcriptional regulator, AraC family [Mesorhizobium australicum]
MDLMFDTQSLPQAQRYTAWRDAICDVYVNVDVAATRPEDYRGFIREARFGEVVMTDILLSEQRIRRNRQHIARLDKDCYYLQLVHSGNFSVIQRGSTLRSNAARGAIFCASELYELQCHGEARSFYLELPRDDFASRFDKDKVPVSALINTTQGLGRIATEFCASLATEGSKLGEGIRAGLGDRLMDMLALTLQSGPDDSPLADGSVRRARLLSVQNWIEAHIGEHDLTLERIAVANGVSLRHLHMLFEGSEMTASEWIWSRRLQLAYDRLARGDRRTITAVAYDLGFNSSAHFSTLFRRKYGISPRDLLHR